MLRGVLGSFERVDDAVTHSAATQMSLQLVCLFSRLVPPLEDRFVPPADTEPNATWCGNCTTGGILMLRLSRYKGHLPTSALQF